MAAQKNRNAAVLRRFWAAIGIILLAAIGWFGWRYLRSRPVGVSLSELNADIAGAKVKAARIAGESVEATYITGRRVKATISPSLIPELTKDLSQAKVQFEIQPSPVFQWSTIISFSIPIVLAFALAVIALNKATSGGSKALEFGKSRARLHSSAQKRVLLRDVAGIDRAKEQVMEVVDFVRDPARFQRLGARPPQGLLLVGDPGTGKTLLARAIAGEASVPFFSISGSDFVEMFVGVGASRVRDLFEQGRKNAPCIIFIDELDSVARHRGSGRGWGHDEREQTLNQLLVEMDGFDSREGLIIIAATNRPDALDPALTRPGRFDRKITVPLPDAKGRAEIFRVHLKNKPLADDVDVDCLARIASGLSGADIMNISNEAAISAARHRRKVVTMSDLESGLNKILPSQDRLATLDAELKDSIIGQERVKATVSSLVKLHYGYARRAEVKDRSVRAKGCLLLLGPHGVGKTTTVRKCARHLDVPLFVTSATRLTGGPDLNGYHPIQHLLRELYLAADGNLARAQHGVVCIEGLERALEFTGGENKYFQDGIATLIKGAVVDVPLRLHDRDSEVKRIITNDVLFVLEANLPELELVVRRCLNRAPYITTPELVDSGHLELVRNGISETLLDAISMVTTADALMQHELEGILNTADYDADLRRHEELLGTTNGTIRIRQHVKRIAEYTKQRNEGARGLTKALRDVSMAILSNPGQAKQAVQRALAIPRDSVTPEHYSETDVGAILAELPGAIGIVIDQTLHQGQGCVVVIEVPDTVPPEDTTGAELLDWFGRRGVPATNLVGGDTERLADGSDIELARAQVAIPLFTAQEGLRDFAKRHPLPTEVNSVDLILEKLAGGEIDGLRALAALRGVGVRIGFSDPPASRSAAAYLVQAYRSFSRLDLLKLGFELRRDGLDEVGKCTRTVGAASAIASVIVEIERDGALSDAAPGSPESVLERVRETLTDSLKPAVLDLIGTIRESPGEQTDALDGISVRREWLSCRESLVRRGHIRSTPNLLLLLAAADSCVRALSAFTSREVSSLAESITGHILGRADRPVERLHYWMSQIHRMQALLSGEKSGANLRHWNRCDFDPNRMVAELAGGFPTGASALQFPTDIDWSHIWEVLEVRYEALRTEAAAKCEKHLRMSATKRPGAIVLAVDEFDSEALSEYCDQSKITFIRIIPASR